jgi:hypothetical protein
MLRCAANGRYVMTAATMRARYTTVPVAAETAVETAAALRGTRGIMAADLAGRGHEVT